MAARDNKWFPYVMDMETLEGRRVLVPDADTFNYTSAYLSADGRHLVMTRIGNSVQNYSHEVVSLRLSNGRLRKIISGRGLAWVHGYVDGTWFKAIADPGTTGSLRQLYLIDARSTRQILVSEDLEHVY